MVHNTLSTAVNEITNDDCIALLMTKKDFKIKSVGISA